MKKTQKKFLTVAEFRSLSPGKFRPVEPRWKKEALGLLEDWTGTLSPEAKIEAATMIDSAAHRFLFFRFKAKSIPTAAELKRMLQRRLLQIQNFRRSIEGLNYWEWHWINGDGSPPVIGDLRLDLEAAEYELQRSISYGSANGYWRRRGRPDARWELLMDCHALMSRFKKRRTPGATKGDGILVNFTRCVYCYAVGENEKNGANFDRQIDAFRGLNRELDAIFRRSRRTPK